MNGVRVGVMKEGSTKAGGVEQLVCGVVNFTPFGFADAIHFLMFGSGGFDSDAKVIKSGDELDGGKCCSSIRLNEADQLCSTMKFCVGEPRFKAGDDC